MAINLTYGSGHCCLLSFTIILLLSWGTSGAQSVIHGSVVEKLDHPVSNANVLLLNGRDSSLAKGSISNERGNFSFENIPAGQYIISFTCTGFEHASLALSVSGKEPINLPPQKLIGKSNLLAEMTVTARKPLFEQKIDRLVVNVENSITSAGSTVLDVLERSPGVIVDRQNNAISLSGKSGVVLMINGKITHMPIDAVVQMLDGMSSGNIEKIELITTPPANLDAEGNAGYINIVLKENNQYGTNGSLSLSMGYGNREMPAANISFNHREGKLNLYGDYSFSRRHMEQDWYFDHLVTNKGATTETPSNTYRNTVQRNHNAQLGVDYTLDKNTVIGALVSGYDNRWSMTATNNSAILINQQTDTTVNILNTEVNEWKSYSANVNLQHNFSDKQKFTYNADYIHYLDNNPVRYADAYYDRSGNFLYNQDIRSSKNTPIEFWVNAADYSTHIGKSVGLETGLKSTVSRFNNDVEIDRLMGSAWTKDPAFSAKYKLQENISAAYASVNVAAGKKTDLKAGLRYEYTNSNLGSDSVKNIVDRHYGNLFPSIFVTHRLNDNNTVDLSYSRRITRPTFNDMAPFVIFVDPNTFFSGNPALQPAISDAVKADYSYKKYLISLAYTYEAGSIANFSPKVDSLTNVETLSSVNLQDTKTVTVTLALPFELASWWSMSYSAIAIWQETNASYNNSPLQLRQANFHLTATETFRLPKSYSVELSGFYQSPTLFGLYKTAAFGSLDIGMQKKLGGKNGTIRLAFNDILNTLKFNLSINQPSQNLVLVDRLQFIYPSVKLTYSRNFGKDKLTARRNRSTGSEDEQGRVQ